MLPVHHKAQPQRRGNTVYLFLLVLLSVGLVVEFGYWRKQIAHLVVINEQLRSNAAELRAQNDKLSSSVADQKDALHSVMKQNSQLDGETRATQEALHRHEEEAKSAKEQLTQSNTKIKELQGQIEDLRGQRDACEKESAQNSEDLKGITNQLEVCNDELSALTSQADQASQASKAKSVEKPVLNPPVTQSEPDAVTRPTTQVADSTTTGGSGSQEIKDVDTDDSQGDAETDAKDGGSVDPTDLVAPDENKSQGRDEEEGVASKGTVSRSKATFNPSDESNETQEEIRTVEEA